jgi:hypothetical protein
MFDLTLLLLILAVAFTGLLTGASLDQSIKQLPARHKIGITAFSRYSQASDLGNGVIFYAVLGIGSALLTVLAALSVFLVGLAPAQALPFYIAAVVALLHTLTTAKAAPINFSQKRYQTDQAQLANVFDRFARWQALRAALQVITFGILLWTLVIYGR